MTGKKRQLAKICVSISASDTKELESFIDKAFRQGADFVEIRFDFLSPSEFDAALAIVAKIKRKAVFTLRSQDQGGKFSGSEKDRVGMLERLVKEEPMFVDIELDTIEENDALADLLERSSRTPILVSWHDFKRTPPVEDISEIMTRMRRYSSFAKIVTMARSVKDALLVLSLYETANDLKLIAFAMGEAGVLSRVLCPVVGNAPYTYASLDAAVAPGQITLKEMRNLYDRFEGR